MTLGFHSLEPEIHSLKQLCVIYRSEKVTRMLVHKVLEEYETLEDIFRCYKSQQIWGTVIMRNYIFILKF